MKITVFQSAQGDCLLVSGEDGTNMLVDGGMSGSYRTHVAPTLGKMAEDGEVLDLVCVSHIDQDHILGVLKMLDDAVAWRVFDYQTSRGNHWREPDSPRPPEIHKIWHNAFTDQLNRNRGDIEDLLVLQMQHEFFCGNVDSAGELLDLINSERQALMLADRISENQLGIPLNPEFTGGLMFVFTPHEALPVGAMNCHVIGPYGDELDDLRREWNDWVRENRDTIERLRRKAREDAQRLGLAEFDALTRELRLAADLGERRNVTAPNLASLMLLVEENNKRVLLTGDGHWETILSGLEDAGQLDDDGQIHVDVLKIPHHGSEHNTTLEFYKKVTADHYVFCGDGAHENPDERVVNALLDSRIGTAAQRSRNSAASGSFKLWFNSSEAAAVRSDRARHMRKLEQQLSRRASSDARVRFKFLTTGSKLAFTV